MVNGGRLSAGGDVVCELFMKGVILAGGTGSRLWPLTRHTNKHLLPIHGRAMILYPLCSLTAAGIDEILVVTAAAHLADFKHLLGDGRGFGARRLEIVAEPGPGGIAAALSVAGDFCRGDRLCAVLGDNLFGHGIAPHVEAYTGQQHGARIVLKPVDTPERFGIARFEGDRLVTIEEKPARPQSHFAVTGLYFYPPDVFDVCRTLEPSARGELEITDVNNHYLRRGQLKYDVLEGWWSDAGTFESLKQAGELITRHGFDGDPSRTFPSGS